MNQPPRIPPVHVPVLTEVLELNHLQPGESLLTAPMLTAEALPVPLPPVHHAAPVAQSMVAMNLHPEPKPDAMASVSPPYEAHTQSHLDEAQMAQRVLADVQRQVDSMLEFRLREALAPILARHTDTLVQDLRQSLTGTMQDVVSRAVAQEMARQRSKH